MTDNNYVVIFRKNEAIVKRTDGSIAMTAKRRGQLYMVNGNKEDATLNIVEHAPNKLRQWHERFGHLNLHDLKKLKINDMVSGINFDPEETSFDCETCYTEKIC